MQHFARSVKAKQRAASCVLHVLLALQAAVVVSQVWTVLTLLNAQVRWLWMCVAATSLCTSELGYLPLAPGPKTLGSAVSAEAHAWLTHLHACRHGCQTPSSGTLPNRHKQQTHTIACSTQPALAQDDMPILTPEELAAEAAVRHKWYPEVPHQPTDALAQALQAAAWLPTPPLPSNTKGLVMVTHGAPCLLLILQMRLALLIWRPAWPASPDAELA